MNQVQTYKQRFANETWVMDDYDNHGIIFHDFTDTLFGLMWKNFRDSKHSNLGTESLPPLKDRLKGIDLNEVMFGKEFAGMMKRMHEFNAKYFPEQEKRRQERIAALMSSNVHVTVRHQKISVQRFTAYLAAKSYPHAYMTKEEYDSAIGPIKKKKVTIKPKRKK